jgi:hypothetical protein
MIGEASACLAFPSWKKEGMNDRPGKVKRVPVWSPTTGDMFQERHKSTYTAVLQVASLASDGELSPDIFTWLASKINLRWSLVQCCRGQQSITCVVSDTQGF